jgi:hypothetical protein
MAAPESHLFRDMTVGLVLGAALNGLAVGLCLLGYAIPMAGSELVGGAAGELVGLFGMFSMYWAMGFSIVQFAYLIPFGVIAVVRGRGGVALGLLISAAITFLLQTACVGVGVGLLMYMFTYAH